MSKIQLLGMTQGPIAVDGLGKTQAGEGEHLVVYLVHGVDRKAGELDDVARKMEESGGRRLRLLEEQAREARAADQAAAQAALADAAGELLNPDGSRMEGLPEVAIGDAQPEAILPAPAEKKGKRPRND